MKFDRTKAKRIMPGLFQLAPDRFVVITQWKDPRTGRRRKRERVASSLAEAVTLRQELKGEEQGRARKATPVCLSDFVEQWLRVHAHRFAPSTRDRYAEALAHACVAMGDVYVPALEAADVRKWVSDQAKDYAAPTINGRLRVLKQALDDAVVDRVLASNPARAVRSLKEPRTRGPRGTALSAEQFRALLEATRQLSGAGLSEDVARMLQVVAWTGLRRGELLALRFTD
jgi:site-specific recombinase XerC